MTDADWPSLEPLLPAPKPRGRPRVHPGREMLRAMFSGLRRGWAWRRLPQERPPWQTVSHSFRCWRLVGRWTQGHLVWREAVRLTAGRAPPPSAGMLERHAVTTPGVGGVRGEDGAMQLSGRTRHLLGDTHGVVVRATGHRAALQE